MCLEHRSLLDHPPGFRTFRGTDLFERLAHRGDVAGLGAVLAEAPDLLRPSYAAAIMQAAALAGRAEIVRMLLDGGVGADHPFRLPVSVTGVAFERVVFVTPLCAARMKRRSVVESLLLAAGANEDVFTSAFLGDLTSLARMLTADPSLAQATDPAVDVLDITPVEHAVAGGQASALRLILDHVAHPLPGYVRALRGAAAQGSLAMVELLLAAQKVRPASGLSTRPRCTTPPGQASCGPSRYSSTTEQTQTPATVTAARRLTGWNKRHRRCREPQVPGADVEAVDTVDGQGSVQIGDSAGRLGHDEAERLLRGQHAARGPVPGGRVADSASHLASLGGRVDVRHDDAFAAQVESPPDIGGMRMPDPGDGRRPR
jgi:ankyrin repeat protein